jgi:hypothetical protein
MGKKAAGSYRPGGGIMLRRLLGLLKGLWVELEMRGIFPERIGRYRVVDTLQTMEDRLAIQTK